jgi:O-antigen ligase
MQPGVVNSIDGKNMIIVLFLICYLIFINNVFAGLYAVTACIALWLEWDVGINIGIIDIFLFASLPVAISLSKKHYEGNDTIKILVVLFIFFNCLTSFFNPLLAAAPLSEILWDIYKSAYIPLLFFVFYALIRNTETVKKLIILIIVSSTFSSIFGLIQAITQKPITISTGTYAQYLATAGYIQYFDIMRSFGTLSGSNHFGGFLIIPISLTASILFTPNSVNTKKWLWSALVLQVSALLFSLSRASLIGTSISLIIISILTKAYKSKPTLLLIVALIVSTCIGEMLGFRIIPYRIKSRVISIKNGKEDDAMTPRFARWEYFYKRSLEKPFTGWGYIADDEVSIHFEDVAVSPHNTYLLIAVKHGYISLAILLVIFILMLKKAFKNRCQSHESLTMAINTGIFSSMIGAFGFSAMYDSYFQESQIDILFWLLAAIVFKCLYLDSKGESVVQMSNQINY